MSSIELNQTIEQKIERLNSFADEVNGLYTDLTGKTNVLLNSGIYEGSSATEFQNQYDGFKRNFETYYTTIKGISNGFKEAKEKHEASEMEKKKRAGELNTNQTV